MPKIGGSGCHKEVGVDSMLEKKQRQIRGQVGR